jgi:hypothetical protein
MARWEPNARQRLERAALALFTEHGYDATTVAEIADRAGLTKSTFFRHFADKREVLFGGQDLLTELFTEAIRTAPPSATTADCLAAALQAAAAAFTPDRHDLAPQRRGPRPSVPAAPTTPPPAWPPRSASSPSAPPTRAGPRRTTCSPSPRSRTRPCATCRPAPQPSARTPVASCSPSLLRRSSGGEPATAGPVRR